MPLPHTSKNKTQHKMNHQSEFNKELSICWGASSRFALLGFMPFMVVGQPYGLDNISEKRGRFFSVYGNVSHLAGCGFDEF